MEQIIHRAEDRGNANHGWLNAFHSFSFANYYDPDKIQFGALRVLNDDTIQGGQGFGMHPHDNMEIITIPLKGTLEHKDSMGNEGVINAGEIQVMSAGTGIFHSEFNHNKNEEVKLFQIWLIPKKRDVEPRYDQIRIADLMRPNEFCLFVSPYPEDKGTWIHQDAWFSLCELDNGKEVSYELFNNNNGMYIFLIDGSVNINNVELKERDAIGTWNTDDVSLVSHEKSRILLMEIPMI